MNNFETSLEAIALLDKMREMMNGIPYNSDLRKMYGNLCSMVSELSQLEVKMRRSYKGSRYHREHAKIIRSMKFGMNQLNNLLLIARLMA